MINGVRNNTYAKSFETTKNKYNSTYHPSHNKNENSTDAYRQAARKLKEVKSILV